MVTADRHGFFKYMASALAEKHGMRATFMPKPFINLSGNGCHVHHSLWRGDEEVFLNRFRVGSTGEDVRGLDLSADPAPEGRKKVAARTLVQLSLPVNSLDLSSEHGLLASASDAQVLTFLDLRASA